MRYHREVWAAGEPKYATKDTLKVTELRRAFELAKSKSFKCSNEHAGPIGLAAAAADLVGWTFTNPFTIVDSANQTIDLWQGPPKQMQQAYASAHRAFHQAQLENALVMSGENYMGLKKG